MHLVRVVSGIQHRLGQQRHRPDWGLELVADVGHEISPGRFQPDRVRFVRRVDHGVLVTQRPDLPENSGRPATGSGALVQRRKVDMDHLAGVAHLLGGLGCTVIRTRAMDQPQFGGRGVGQHHIAHPIEQDYSIV
jgi:hypothetical protein